MSAGFWERSSITRRILVTARWRSAARRRESGIFVGFSLDEEEGEEAWSRRVR